MAEKHWATRCEAGHGDRSAIVHFAAVGRRAMDEKRLDVGARLVVSTDHGDQEDEVIRVLGSAADAGIWVVETARNGRVVVLRGREEAWSVKWTAAWNS